VLRQNVTVDIGKVIFVDMDELQFVLIVLFFLHLTRNIKLFSIVILYRSTHLIQNCVRISLLPVAILKIFHFMC
jgi:hypothetical protein